MWQLVERRFSGPCRPSLPIPQWTKLKASRQKIENSIPVCHINGRLDGKLTPLSKILEN